ncbi:MAG: hypothetical protein ACO3JL_03700 [Myxococcota bacterium]
MEEARRPRERELVLAPNEYAYVLDTTKGHINCYVGPNKTSLAQTDELVIFDDIEKRFRSVEMKYAVMLFATAPANWYVVLKNPAKDGVIPKAGSANAMLDINVGQKVILQGPVSFPLWPGQMARVFEGHRLKANQYLVVRVYDAVRAQERWRDALGLSADVDDHLAPRFVAGEQRVIRGTDVSFYMPPTGVEVVADERGQMVRDAVTLTRLEYCVLEGDDGRRTYVRGEAVVFPLPNQRFLEHDGSARQRGIELSDTSGLYIKVIAPYVDEDRVAHQEGEELFLRGNQRIYFPREEHAVIRYGDTVLHHAIAIPKGEGRYVLDRESGEVSLVRGPAMFLPDPRRQVLTRRVLSERDCSLLYPGNSVVAAHNRALREGVHGQSPVATDLRDAEEGKPAHHRRSPGGEPGTDDVRLSRSERFAPPRVITLNNHLEGAVKVKVWSGYAIQVVDPLGGRRVVQGPATVLLEYDENLEALELSRGTPKQRDRQLETVFLKLAGNKVSDRVRVTTAVLVEVEVGVRYRVTFEGEDPSRWFSVDDYVQLLCDHANSLIQSHARRLTVQELRASVTEVVREAVLGIKPDGTERPGLFFTENSMRVHEVDVVELEVIDEHVEELLKKAQANSIAREIQVAMRTSSVLSEGRLEELSRKLAKEQHESSLLQLELKSIRDARERQCALDEEAHLRALTEQERQRELHDVALRDEIERQRMSTQRAQQDLELLRRRELQELAERSLQSRVDAAVRQAQAFSPHLVETLQRACDERLLESIGQNFAELSAVEGKGLLETARKFLDFVPQQFAPALRMSAVPPRESQVDEEFA